MLFLGGILLLRRHERGEGGFLKCLHFSTRGEGGSRKYLHRHLTSLFFSKVRIFKKKFFALQMNIFFSIFSHSFHICCSNQNLFLLGEGGGSFKCLCSFYGGSSKCLCLSTRGEGGSKMAEILST